MYHKFIDFYKFILKVILTVIYDWMIVQCIKLNSLPNLFTFFILTSCVVFKMWWGNWKHVSWFVRLIFSILYIFKYLNQDNHICHFKLNLNKETVLSHKLFIMPCVGFIRKGWIELHSSLKKQWKTCS